MQKIENNKNPLAILKVVFALVASLTLLACSSQPQDSFDRDRTTWAEYYPIEEPDSDEMKKINYLARFLANAETRREIAAEVYNEEFIERWSAFDYGTAAAMTTDLVTGQLVSNLGRNIDLAVTGLVGLYRMFNDGSYNHVGQIWLPDNYKGIDLVDEDTAQKAMLVFTESRLDYIAQRFGYTVKCEVGCDDKTMQRSYVFSIDHSQPRPYHFSYQPEEFGFFINFSTPPVKMEDSDILPLLVGEPLAWKTSEPYSTAQLFFVDLNYSETGDVEVVTNSQDITLISAQRLFLHTEMGRHVMSAFHSTPYSMFGSNLYYPDQFYYNGEVYRFSGRFNKELMRWKVDMSLPEGPESPIEAD